MLKHLELDLAEPLDPVASREERRATGRMVAVIVALLMIFSGFYHAWIKKIPVLAGVMVPALIMLLYAAWVLFLAKREKQRRIKAEIHLRASATALSEILIAEPHSNQRRNDRIKHTREPKDAIQKPTTSAHRNISSNRKELQAKQSILKQSSDSKERPKSSNQPAKKSSHSHMKPMIIQMPPLPPLPPFIPPSERNEQSPTLFRSLSAR